MYLMLRRSRDISASFGLLATCSPRSVCCPSLQAIMCLSIVKAWLRYVNVVFAVIALTLLGFAIYIASATRSVLGWSLLGLSLFLLLACIIGFLLAKTGSSLLSRLYLVLFGAWTLFCAVFGIALLFAEKSTVDLLQRMAQTEGGAQGQN